MRCPLEGIRVVSIEVSASGPLCARMLGELGADVIKIERPGKGDLVREWDTIVKGLSAGYAALNYGKRNITLNLKTEEGMKIIKSLIERADVFLTNYAPETIEKMGLTYETLKTWNEKIIYCGISGYGKDGPYRSEKAYDLLVQGETGVILMTGYPDRPAKIGLSIADVSGGMYALLGIITALYHRERTGEGQEIDISMFESLLSWHIYFPYAYWYRGEKLHRVGMRHHLITPYGPYQAGDGKYVNIAVMTNEDFEKFCRDVINRPELLKDPRFLNNELRVKNRVALDAVVEDAFRTQDRNHWIKAMKAADIPVGRLNDIDEVLNHPQAKAREIVKQIDSPVGPINALRHPLRMSKCQTRLGRLPAQGENTKEVLKELGYSDEKIEMLVKHGVV